MNVFSYLLDPAHWTGPQGIPARLVEHLGYVALTLLIALVIAVPIGAWIGHTGRGGFLVVGLANGLRALPTLGLLVLHRRAPPGSACIGPITALVILAVPPILAGTYAGVRNVDPAVVDAARGMGMRGREVLLGVELPNALPLIIGGIRSSVLQVISTATIAAYVGARRAGPLHHRRPRPVRDFPQMIAGSLLVALLAVVADLLLAGLQKLIVSPGLRAAPRPAPAACCPLERPPTPRARRDPDRRNVPDAHFPDRPQRRGAGGPRPRPHRLRRWGRPAVQRLRPDLGRRGAERHDRRRLGELHREPDPRRDLRAGAGGQGRHGREAAQHRQPGGLHPGPAGRVDRPHPRVQRRAAAVLRQDRRRDRARRRLHRAAGGAAGQPDRARQVGGRGQGRRRRHPGHRDAAKRQVDRRPRRRSAPNLVVRRPAGVPDPPRRHPGHPEDLQLHVQGVPLARRGRPADRRGAEERRRAGGRPVHHATPRSRPTTSSCWTTRRTTSRRRTCCR